MRRKHWVLACFLIGVPIFLTNCIHIACMTGVTCVPYVGPPEWYENLADRNRDRAHKASLSPLQRAVLDRNVVRVEKILRDDPDQVRAKTRSDEAPLYLAVTTWPPSKRIVELLLEAGAEGFVPQGEQYAFETPFGHVISFADNPEVVEAFLRTGKLDPLSAEAVEYLEYSVRHDRGRDYRDDSLNRDWAFERMLAYGVPLENAPGILLEIVASGTLDTLENVLQRSIPLDQGEWRDASTSALHKAVYDCKFDMANRLLDAGVVIADRKGSTTGLISSISNRCARAYGDKPFSADEQAARRVLLSRLVAGGGDLNASNDACPAWLGGENTSCRLPRDDVLIKDYLKLGADPYWLNPRQEKTALGMALNECDSVREGEQDRVVLLLAQPPRRGEPATTAGLNRSLSAVFGAQCPQMARLDVADRLIAYGADINAFDDRGDTNLGKVMFYKDDAVYQTAASYLLANGARVDAPDEWGHTALYWLLDYDHPRMERVLWLARHGARLQNVMNQPELPKSLMGPNKAEIIRRIEAAALSPPD